MAGNGEGTGTIAIGAMPGSEAAPNKGNGAHSDASSAPAYSPQSFGGMVAFGISPQGKQEFSLISSSKVSITSKTLHYGAVNFEGAKVAVHQKEDGRGHRLYMVHYDWNIARLQKGIRTWGFGSPGLSQEEHATALVNLLYANGWDAAPVTTLDGKFSPANDMYVRPFTYFGESNNITLRNEHPFGFALIVSPQPPYHGGGKETGMALLSVPEPRNLAAAWEKRGDNYPNSMLWVRRMRDFAAWVAEGRPKIYVDGVKAVASGYENAVGIIRESLKEILFRNRNGAATEGSAENVGIISGSRLMTPGIDEGCLPGFTMQKVELIVQGMGMETRRESFGIEEFKRADAPLITGNAAGAVMPKWLVECSWDRPETGEYLPEGPVCITTLGTAQGAELYGKIKQEQDRIIAGKSQLGKFGVYADEFVTAADIRNIREMTAEMVKSAEKRIAAQLFGRAPEGWRTRLAHGRQITYAQRFGIK